MKYRSRHKLFFYVTCRYKEGQKTTLQNHIIKLIPIVQLRPHVLHRQLLIDLVINMFYICPVWASLFTAKNFSCPFKTYKENTKCRENTK